MENLGNSGINLFDLDDSSFIQETPKQVDNVIFNPDPDKSPDGNYVATVRFLPNPADPANKSKILKYYSWLKDPVSGEEFSVDCPSTIGKKSIIKDTFWALRNSDSARDQELSKEFKRKTYYYSLIQVVDDKVNPENNGKVFVFRYGVQVNDFVEKEMKPKVGVPRNPFNILTGREFLLDVVKKYGWNNYDSCQFVGDSIPLKLDGTPIERTQEDLDRVNKFLTDNCPDMSKYEFRPWNDEIEGKVRAVIRNTVPDGRLVSKIIGAATEASNAAPTPTPQVESVAPAPVSAPAPEPVQEKVEAPAPTPAAETAPPAKDDVSSLDDLYADL
jgi:hypothetical protein